MFLISAELFYERATFLLFVVAPSTVGCLYQLHCTRRLSPGRLTALLTAKTPVNPRVYKRLR